MSSTYLPQLPPVFASPALYFQGPSPSGNTAPTWYFTATLPGSKPGSLAVNATGKIPGKADFSASGK